MNPLLNAIRKGKTLRCSAGNKTPAPANPVDSVDLLSAIRKGQSLRHSVPVNPLLGAIRKGKNLRCSAGKPQLRRIVTPNQFLVHALLCRRRNLRPESDMLLLHKEGIFGNQSGMLLSEIKGGKGTLRAHKKSTVLDGRRSLLRDIQTSLIGSPAPRSPPQPLAAMAKLSAFLDVLSKEPPAVLMELLLFPSFSAVLEKCAVQLQRGGKLKNCIHTQRFANLATLFSIQLGLPFDGIALRNIWVDAECCKLVQWLRVHVPASAPIFINLGREMVANELKLHFSSSKFDAFKCRVCRSMVMVELSRQAAAKLRQDVWPGNSACVALQPSNAFIMDRETQIALQKLPTIVQRSHREQAGRSHWCHNPATFSSQDSWMRGQHPRVESEGGCQDQHRGWSITTNAVRVATDLPCIVKKSHALFTTIIASPIDDSFTFVLGQTPPTVMVQNEQKVRDILAMGFIDVEAIKLALVAESGSVQRAVECLLR